ncbi:hypothetical protein [uncultured Alteromonas sp.]|jgi:hypothetical protein|uniref:hypothetical protein n=1 Tax=uncultured Alteromonas sp. TaxID=179113 RepID=UPI0025E33143|nr:hypothetical protein [uncultured Alteromonas sp.]
MNNTGYTYQIKRTGRSFCQLENKGLVSYQVFLTEFKQYLWPATAGEARPSNETTLSVKHVSSNTELFVSTVGSAEDFAYLVGVVNAPENVSPRQSSDGAGRRVQVYISEQHSDVSRLFSQFFRGQWALLYETLGALPVFLEPQQEHDSTALD